MKEDAFEKFVAYCAAIDERQDICGHKTLSEFVNFFQNHWEAIVERESGELCGSCTEPLVSHVRSERLSRNPLAWSEDGLRQMAMMRVYTQNGGKVTVKDVRVSRSKSQRADDKQRLLNGFATYKHYADKQVDEFLNKKRDCAPVPNRSGKLDGTLMLRKAYGQMRNAFSLA